MTIRIMGWLEEAKREKVKSERLVERTKRWLEELHKSRLLNLIEEVKSEIEKETNHKYNLSPKRIKGFGNNDTIYDPNHFGGRGNPHRTDYIVKRETYHHFTISAKPNGVYLGIMPAFRRRIFISDKPIKIDPHNVTKKDIYKWFERISKNL